MPDVGVRHEEVPVANSGDHPTTRSSRLQGNALADDISVADNQLAWLSAVLKVLGRCAYRGELEDRVAVPDLCVTLNDDVGAYSVPLADNNVWSNYRVWTNNRACPNLCRRAYDRRWVNLCCGC